MKEAIQLNKKGEWAFIIGTGYARDYRSKNQ